MPFHPQPRPPSRAKTRKIRNRDRDAQQREVYALVDRRDRYRCRICGTHLSATAVDMLHRVHHHHIVYRSRGGNNSTSAGICSLCAECHADVHAGRLFISGDADRELVIERSTTERI